MVAAACMGSFEITVQTGRGALGTGSASTESPHADVIESQVPYHDVLLEFPFKGDETPLRSMEHAELISIGTHEGWHILHHACYWVYIIMAGRASTIRPGKPVFRWVFERLVNGMALITLY